MPFNAATYRHNQFRKKAKAAIAKGKALRNGTHYLCDVLTPKRIEDNIKLCVGDAKLYRNLSNLLRRGF